MFNLKEQTWFEQKKKKEKNLRRNPYYASPPDPSSSALMNIQPTRKSDPRSP